MRRMMVCALALLVLGACHGGGSRTTFVNQKNPAETLTVEFQPSAMNHVFNLVHREQDFSEGRYTLKTAEGTTSGTYLKSSDGKKREYTFEPKGGKSWKVEIAQDGSFTDARGVWKRAPATVDVKAPELAKVGN